MPTETILNDKASKLLCELIARIETSQSYESLEHHERVYFMAARAEGLSFNEAHERYRMVWALMGHEA